MHACRSNTVLQQVQGQLDQGQPLPEVAQALGLKYDTLHKAVRAGRVQVPLKKRPPRTPGLPT